MSGGISTGLTSIPIMGSGGGAAAKASKVRKVISGICDDALASEWYEGMSHRQAFELMKLAASRANEAADRANNAFFVPDQKLMEEYENEGRES